MLDRIEASQTRVLNSLLSSGRINRLVEQEAIDGQAAYAPLEGLTVPQVPAWQGNYIYGDFCTAEIFGLAWDGSAVNDANATRQQIEQAMKTAGVEPPPAPGPGESTSQQLEALAKSPKQPELLFALARVEWTARRVDAARSALLQLIETDPANIPAQLTLVELDLAQRNTPAAVSRSASATICGWSCSLPGSVDAGRDDEALRSRRPRATPE